MDTVLFVAGARPNFMKVAPIMRELASRTTALSGELIHTGQHYDYEMSGIFFDQLGLPKPHAFLGVGSGSHGAQTGHIMISFEQHVLARTQRPHAVVVVGDVNSTMACALVAAKLRIPVVHVEAGLRSFDRDMPEEINRQVTDAISDLLLVSEPAGLENLRREGVADERIKYVGNVMIDTLVHQLPAARELDMPARLGVAPRAYALVTLHRPSNVDHDDRLREVVAVVGELATRIPVVFPVHPRTEKRIDELALREVLGGAKLVAPLGYREFLGLMQAAKLAVTDSGGIQEETSFLGVPCITLRSNTERPVTITHGTNRLAGQDLGVARQFIAETLAAAPPSPASIEGWDGRAAARVVDALLAARFRTPGAAAHP